MLTANKSNPLEPEQNDFEETVDIIVDDWFDRYCRIMLGSEQVKALKQTLKMTLQDL